MYHKILPALVALLAGQAQALECSRPDPVQEFQSAMAAPDTYVILLGTLFQAEIRIPPGRSGPYPIPVWFSGKSLTENGFTQPLEHEMTVQVTCAGPWCGDMPSENEAIYFARLQDGAYEIEADVCAFSMFPPDPLTIELLTSCLRGAACVSADLAD